MSKTIPICSLSSGTGKTTIAINLTYELSRMNKRALLINFDNKQTDFILSPENVNLIEECDFDLVDLLKDNFDIQSRIVPFYNCKRRIPNFDLLVSSRCLSESSRAFFRNVSNSDNLLKNLEKIKSIYDYVILDSPAEKITDSVILDNLIVASDLIISPFNDSWESLQTSDILYQKVKEIKGNDECIIFIKNNLSYHNKDSVVNEGAQDLNLGKSWRNKVMNFELAFSKRIIQAFNKRLPAGLFGFKSASNSDFYRNLALYVNSHFYPGDSRFKAVEGNVDEGLDSSEIFKLISRDNKLKEKIERLILSR